MAENDTYYRFLWHHLLITQLSPDLIIRQISAQVLPPSGPTLVKAFWLIVQHTKALPWPSPARVKAFLAYSPTYNKTILF